VPRRKRIPAGQREIESTAGAEALRWCSRCETYKPVSEFYKAAGWACKSRVRAYQREYPRQPRRLREYNLRKNYGITHDDYDTLLAAQHNVCTACGLPETGVDPRTQQPHYLVVDHDHRTGRIRGLLCSACNVALGLLQEDPVRIQALLAYTERCRQTDAA